MHSPLVAGLQLLLSSCWAGLSIAWLFVRLGFDVCGCIDVQCLTVEQLIVRSGSGCCGFVSGMGRFQAWLAAGILVCRVEHWCGWLWDSDVTPA